MAAEAPNPRTLKTWEDAFQYPIPVARKLEQRLRANADENREKLRALVGASYRDLLDTAETIVDMEMSMEQVEAMLARAGRHCNSRTVERITGNAGKLADRGAVQMHREADSQARRYAFASQLAVLRNCSMVMARLLKGEGSHLVVAKVLVLARLLHKALSGNAVTPPIVGQLWDRVLSARRRLLRRIDQRLASPTCDAAALVETMCAYALATSSTPTQLLRHFHKARLDRIVGLLHRGPDELPTCGMGALRLCIQTCQDTHTIFPRRLADSLARLKAHPLVQDADVRALYELNLDVHDRWMGDEARNYTPWPRHDELQRAEAEKILHQWSKQAIAAFLGGIRKALKNEHRLEQLASLRQELVETWILSGSRMAGVKSANVLDDLRATINTHLEGIVRSHAQNLSSVVSGVSQMLKSRSAAPPTASLSLWGSVPKTAHLTNGAASFKSEILNTHQGRDNSVIDVVSTFDAWMSSVLQVKSIIKSMKEARWDDTFADDDEDEDSNDDDFGDSRQTLLSDDDPRLLEEATQEALTQALRYLGESFVQIVGELTAREPVADVQEMCFVLRVMREISEKIPTLRLQEKATPLATPFTLELLKPLHVTLAKQVVQSPTKLYEKMLTRAVKTASNSHILWEGHPSLPAQPSPGAFSYLQGLTKAMAAHGSDLWAPASVSVLKRIASEELATLLRSNLNDVVKTCDKSESTTELAIEGDRENGVADTSPGLHPSGERTARAALLSPSVEVRDQKLKQAAFDALFIQRFLGSIGNGDPLDELLKNVDALEENTMVRLKKSAADYAKKTYLLFALLA
ncbi:hypothetical protein K458DRAFT_293085 [Lentithecium fluviatile CBS 122367]|uniref:Conserved oligomeric Golgi complex subunit 1 n=1 Tax=Lentithecium fluviatile CBS 122367 TaxID=1168545 RepID=A0A6G1JEJ9_9PLEO|nr:hypothetical protein K458DRAFT_293085 [Lentithecium fluviatile CBS 122367]